MSTNIQKPIAVPVSELIEKFGSYFAQNSRGSNGESCKTSETLGPKLHYKEAPIYSDALFELEQFNNYETLEANMAYYYENQVDYYNKILDKQTFNISYLFKYVLNKFGFFKKTHEEISLIKNYIATYQELSKMPFRDSPVKRLPDTVMMPQYLLEDDKYYYYPSYYNTKIIVRRMAIIKQTICKVTRYYNDYQYSVNYILVDVDNTSFKMNYEHVKLTHFDGVKWNSKFDDKLLFVNEEDAKNYVKEKYQEAIKEIS